MWGKDKAKKVDFDRHAGKTTMIAKGTVVNGDVTFEGGLLVEGIIKGNVSAEAGTESLLRLSEAGQIEGQINVPNVVVNGKVNGDVHSTAHVELASKAIVNGNVHYHLIEMVMGAAVNGSLVHVAKAEVLPEVSLDLDKSVDKKKKRDNPVTVEVNSTAALETKQSPA